MGVSPQRVLVDEMTTPESPHVDPMDALRRFLEVPVRAQTYRNMAYLLLAFPLGLAYFVVVTTGLSMGVGLLVTIVGIPLLLLTLLGTTLLAGFEASLANWLLDLDVPAPPPADDLAHRGFPTTVSGLLESLEQFLGSPTTWTSLVLVLVKFVFGIVAFVALTVVAVLVGTMLAAPLVYDLPGVAYNFGPFLVDTPLESAAVSLAGVVALFVGLHALNGLARLFGMATATLLGSTNTQSPQTDDA